MFLGKNETFTVAGLAIKRYNWSVIKQVEDKLRALPKSPGVYFHKDAAGEIIYIGKAARLNNRVRQYFQKSRTRDPKTDALVAEIADIDWIEVDSEVDALFLEAELVRRYMPRYNILLRDDKSLAFVRISYTSDHPTVTVTRRPLDDGARYFGPYFSAFAVRRALKYLRRAFPYSTHFGTVPKRACLLYHLGLCPGLEDSKTSLNDYRANLRKLIKYLEGDKGKLIKELEKEMNKAAKAQRFEDAAVARNQLRILQELGRQIIFSDKEFMDISKDQGLQGLADLLGLPAVPRVIEGYDISHMSGTDTVASMVVFVGGLPAKDKYRKFKMRIPGNDDFAHMNEVITRRLGEKHIKEWGKPSLFLIDGGKGQLAAALKARDAAGYSIPMIGLAKREEQIVVAQSSLDKGEIVLDRQAIQEQGGYITPTADFHLINLPHSGHVVKLLQRIRDESHRFAVSYHSVLKTKRQTASWLDEVPGIGPATRKKLLKTFGSVRGIINAQDADLQMAIGSKKAAVLRQHAPALTGEKRAVAGPKNVVDKE